MNPALNVMFMSVLFMSINMNYLLLQHTSMDIVTLHLHMCVCAGYFKRMKTSNYFKNVSFYLK